MEDLLKPVGQSASPVGQFVGRGAIQPADSDPVRRHLAPFEVREVLADEKEQVAAVVQEPGDQFLEEVPQVGRSELDIIDDAHQLAVSDGARHQVGHLPAHGLPRELGVVGELGRPEGGQGMRQAEGQVSGRAGLANREPERNPPGLDRAKVAAHQGRLAHAGRSLDEDQGPRAPRDLSKEGELVFPTHKRIRRSRKGSREKRDGARLLLEELAPRVGQGVDELLPGPSTDVAPPCMELPLLEQVGERTGHRAGMVAQRCREFPLADAVRCLGRRLVRLDVVENLYREMRY